MYTFVIIIICLIGVFALFGTIFALLIMYHNHKMEMRKKHRIGALKLNNKD